MLDLSFQILFSVFRSQFSPYLGWSSPSGRCYGVTPGYCLLVFNEILPFETYIHWNRGQIHPIESWEDIRVWGNHSEYMLDLSLQILFYCLQKSNLLHIWGDLYLQEGFGLTPGYCLLAWDRNNFRGWPRTWFGPWFWCIPVWRGPEYCWIFDSVIRSNHVSGIFFMFRDGHFDIYRIEQCQ